MFVFDGGVGVHLCLRLVVVAEMVGVEIFVCEAWSMPRSVLVHIVPPCMSHDLASRARNEGRRPRCVCVCSVLASTGANWLTNQEYVTLLVSAAKNGNASEGHDRSGTVCL